MEAAYDFLKAVPSIERKLRTLLDVGLSYIRLGQSATTLSGGEAQRVKLALELSKRDTGRTLYILDEPTTGLHFADIDLLLKVLHQLRDAGNTIVVIEHNLDVIKTADWIIDMGPEGGAGGGSVVGVGTPEDIAANAQSHTGRYLKSAAAPRSTQCVADIFSSLRAQRSNPCLRYASMDCRVAALLPMTKNSLTGRDLAAALGVIVIWG